MSPHRRQFFSDIIITAVESGWLDNWANIQDYCHEDDDTSVDFIHDQDIHHVEPHVVCRGLNRILTGEVQIALRYKKMIAEASRDSDASDIDAELADAIIQAGVLNDIVYS